MLHSQHFTFSTALFEKPRLFCFCKFKLGKIDPNCCWSFVGRGSTAIDQETCISVSVGKIIYI